MHTFKVVQQSYDMSTVSFPVLSLSLSMRDAMMTKFDGTFATTIRTLRMK